MALLNKLLCNKKGLRIASINVNGVNKENKQFRILQSLKQLKSDIFVMVDTRLEARDALGSKFVEVREGVFCDPVHTLIQDKHNPEIYNPGIGRGILITARNGSGIDLSNAISSNDGNKLMVDVCTREGNTFKLVALYGPTEDDPAFFVSVIDQMINYDGKIIVIGDFNVKLDPNLDIKPYKQGRPESKQAAFLNARINEGIVVEPFRCFHPTEKIYSYRHFNQKNIPEDDKAESRIDICIISPETLHCVKNVQYCDVHDSLDHSGIFVDLEIEAFEAAVDPPFKVPNRLLSDPDYVCETTRFFRKHTSEHFLYKNNTDYKIRQDSDQFYRNELEVSSISLL